MGFCCGPETLTGENLRRFFPTAFDGTELSNVFNGVCVPGSFDGFLLFQKNPKTNLFGVFSRESVVGLLEVRPRSGTLPCLLPQLYRFFSLLCSVKFQQIFHFFLTHKRTHTPTTTNAFTVSLRKVASKNASHEPSGTPVAVRKNPVRPGNTKQPEVQQTAGKEKTFPTGRVFTAVRDLFFPFSRTHARTPATGFTRAISVVTNSGVPICDASTHKMGGFRDRVLHFLAGDYWLLLLLAAATRKNIQRVKFCDSGTKEKRKRRER